MEIQRLKIEALEERQDLDKFVALYLNFQSYVEQLAPFVVGKVPTASLAPAQESLRLELRDEEHRFIEWDEGSQILNPAIFSLVEEPNLYLGNHQLFEHDLFLATKKFEHLIRNQKRALEELHEKIALLTSEREAQDVTSVERPFDSGSVPETVKRADELAERGLKWAGHFLKFWSWAKGILKAIGVE